MQVETDLAFRLIGVFVAISWAMPLEQAAGEDGAKPASSLQSAEMKRLRQKAKRRKRRIIYNNDGCDVMEAGANTPEGFLSKRLMPALDTQVDSVFYCTGATTMFTHQAEVGETYGKYVTDSSEAMARHARDNLSALKEAGHDPLELAVKFCHENSLEVFFTHRINDIHDTFLDWELSAWKRDHPEHLMGKRGDMTKYGANDPRHWWSSLDFERPEVLDYLIAIIGDVCRRYDVDGIEIDYFRSPMFFRPNLVYKPATWEQVRIMTGFQRRVRETAYREGNRRGRPILVATRVPMSKAACLHVGIDIEAWLKEDLLDVLTIGGGYTPFTMPTRELVEMGHAHDVQVYPTISASGMRGRYSSIEAWRGAAANIWRAGADGIVLFNTFPSAPRHPHFTELGDPETLAGLDKMFAIDNRAILEGDLRQGIVQSQILPVKLSSNGKPRHVNLPVGENIAAAEKAGRLKDVILLVQFSMTSPDKKVKLRLNGHLIQPVKEGGKHGWVTYRPKPAQLRHGDNALEFRVVAQPANEEQIVVQSVELHVSYR